MYLFDTDHWTILQLRNGQQYEALFAKMNEVGRGLCFTSIVTFHEVMNGWLKYIASPKSQKSVVNAYARFEALLDAFSSSELLPFSEKASEEFTRLRSNGCRIGLMDLRIASIGLTHGMIVVTRNKVDFGRVPGLDLQDWIAS
ncbi:MAG: type II toxin-antitoxin system VapC family toxin [Pirellulaceae bacterium]|nr:type II toxin-antitoxin system VapC family toxin [Pirellulaceae bacterium]